MAMGSTKDLHGTEEGADDNALTMPTLPERNHKKKNEPIKKRLPRYQSSLEPIYLSAVVETSPLLSPTRRRCSDPKDRYTDTQRPASSNAACKFAKEIIDATTYRSMRIGMSHTS
jgi:hypothetical protein